MITDVRSKNVRQILNKRSQNWYSSHSINTYCVTKVTFTLNSQSLKSSKKTTCSWRFKKVKDLIYHTSKILYTVHQRSYIPYIKDLIYHTSKILYTIHQISYIPYIKDLIYRTSKILYTVAIFLKHCKLILSNFVYLVWLESYIHALSFVTTHMVLKCT